MDVSSNLGHRTQTGDAVIFLRYNSALWGTVSNVARQRNILDFEGTFIFQIILQFMGLEPLPCPATESVEEDNGSQVENIIW